LIKNAAEALINVSKFMTGYDYTFLEQEDEWSGQGRVERRVDQVGWILERGHWQND
jgi:hypothetical protein